MNFNQDPTQGKVSSVIDDLSIENINDLLNNNSFFIPEQFSSSQVQTNWTQKDNTILNLTKDYVYTQPNSYSGQWHLTGANSINVSTAWQDLKLIRFRRQTF